MNTINERGATQNSTADQGPIGVTWANMLKPMPDLLPDALYPGSKDWLASDYAGRVEWLHRMYEGAKKEIERLSASAVSQTGWVMVPVEPTEKMCAAGFNALEHEPDIHAMWRDMLAAAPTPPKGE